MAGYIGLWISAGRVNAVHLQTGGKKMAVAGAFAADYAGNEALAAALKECAIRFADTAAEWTVGLPMAEFSFRQITFPFKGRGQIAAALGFELEAALPFAAEELATSFVIMKTEGQQSSVLACAIRKERLAHYRALLQKAGIDARAIAPDTTALLYFYRGVILPALRAEPASALIASADEGMLHLCAAATNGHIDFHAAEPDEKEIHRFAAALPAEPEKRFIGGTRPGLPGYAPEQDFWKRQIGSVIDGDAPERLMIPIGLAALGTAGGDELTFAGDTRRTMKFAHDWRIAAATGAAAAVLLLGFLVFRNYMKERTLAMINNQAKTVFAAALPGTKAVKPVFQLEQRLAKLEGKMRRAGLDGGGRNDLIWTLKRMSEALPEGLVLEMDDILYEEESVTVTGRTDRLESVTRAKELFSITTPFKGAELVESKVAPDGRKVTFKLRMPL
ncbi:MAG: hypothetical protein HZA03_08370 [Nitrospinae bacterium]|nr:hypothetical protein [Nitrospinota bacterium]